MLPIIILLAIFILIAIRQVANIKFHIWQIMTAGALLVVATGSITIPHAILAINYEVLLFLFCMFFIGKALEESGLLASISFSLFSKAKNSDQLLLLVIFGSGIASAFLMNDTIAIIGTPVVLLLARQHKMPAHMLLLALAFSITLGSVMSPIGNPQNLLIAVEGNIENPFATFFLYLFLPTILCLLITYFLLKLFFNAHFSKTLVHKREIIKDSNLAMLSKISMAIFLLLILAKIIFSFTNLEIELLHIALIAALPVMVFSPKRYKIMAKLDWHTLIFFASMFIVMQSVWNTQFFQTGIEALKLDILSLSVIFIISILLSQLISNVPLVALYLPLLLHACASTKELMALAAGSTLAGNLLILGAASNIIIIQNAEKSGETIQFFEFAKIGGILTVICVIVYGLFLALL